MMKIKELQTLHFIKGQLESNGSAPTHAEIGKYLNVSSTAGVHKILKTLEREGRILRGRKWREIQILK